MTETTQPSVSVQLGNYFYLCPQEWRNFVEQLESQRQFNNKTPTDVIKEELARYHGSLHKNSQGHWVLTFECQEDYVAWHLAYN
jgi:hypothetical protein